MNVFCMWEGCKFGGTRCRILWWFEGIVAPWKLINFLSYLNHSRNLKSSDDNEKIMTANIIEYFKWVRYCFKWFTCIMLNSHKTHWNGHWFHPEFRKGMGKSIEWQ